MPARPVGALRAAAALPLAALAACQSYTPEPLELAQHRAAFLARTPDAPAIATVSLAAPGPFDLRDSVSLPEAEAVALVFNADLRIARARAGVTLASAEHAGLWADPVVGVDLTRIIQSVAHPWKVMSSVGITIPISGRLEIEKSLAGAEHAAELARVAELEWRTRAELRNAWARWTALDAQARAARDLLGAVEQVLGVVRRMEDANEIPRTEAALFRIELATRAAEQSLLDARAREASLAIAQLMGLSPDAALTLEPALPDPFVDAEANQRSTLQDRSPQLLVSRAEYEAAERSLELEVRRQYPDLTIGPGYGREDGVDEFLLGLSLPLPILNANRQAIAKALAERTLARTAAETTLERLLADLHAAHARLGAAAELRAALEDRIAPLVQAQYDDTRRLAELGEVNTLVLLETLTRRHDASVRLIEARLDEALAAIHVRELAGPDTPPTPPTTPPDTNPTSAAPEGATP
jgi:CRISPR system Cascade subunit CasA